MALSHRIIDWTDQHRDFAFDLVRIYLGIGLLVRGWLFITDESLMTQLLAQTGEPTFVSGAVAHYVVLAHLVGGVLMTVGLLTRIAALVQIPVLIGAVFLIHLNDGLLAAGQSLEFSALVLFLLVLVFVHGSGRLSLDHYLFERTDDSENRARQLSLFESGRSGALDTNGAERSSTVRDAEPVGSEPASRELAPDRAPVRGQNGCTCDPPRDRSDRRVRAERRYGLRALRFLTGTTGVPREIVFRCQVCGNVVERSTSDEDIAYYTYR